MAEEKASETPVFDHVKFKQEMQASQKEQADMITRTIMSHVNSVLDGQGAAKKEVEKVTKDFVSGDADLSDLESEIRDLGADAKQTKALLSVVNKIVAKKAPKFKEEVVNEVEAKGDKTEKKKAYELQAATYYPQILDQSSALFIQAQREYAELDSDAKKSPAASYLAVSQAADKLGISRVTESALRAAQARNENGEPSGTAKKSDKMTERQGEFGAFFGVDPKKFEQKLKEVNSGRRLRVA